MSSKFYSVPFSVNDLDKTAEFYEKLGFEVVRAKDAVRVFFDGCRFAFIDQ